MHTRKTIKEGKDISEANKILIMIHGRGGSAQDILSLGSHLEVKDFALWAPQATNSTWYPYSFMAPPAENEPWLSSALDLLKGIVNEIMSNGISTENIYFLGFSQGACLALEFVTRNADQYGGVVAYTGGLIGDKIYSENYKGDFNGTPIFMGTSNPDAHVPVERFYDTANILRNMNASLTEKVYDHMGHTINQDEVNLANSLVFNPSSK